MEKMRGKTGIGEKNKSLQPIYEDFKPSSGWIHLPNWHILLVDLGFEKEDVKLHVDNLGQVKLSGEKQVGDRKYRRCKEEFSTPEDSNIDGINAKIEGGIVFVIIPKKAIGRQMEEPKKENESKKKQEKSNTKKEEDHGIDGEKKEMNGIKGERELEKREKLKLGLMESVMKKISKNKAIIVTVTALLAISVGLYISHERLSTGK